MSWLGQVFASAKRAETPHKHVDNSPVAKLMRSTGCSASQALFSLQMDSERGGFDRLLANPLGKAAWEAGMDRGFGGARISAVRAKTVHQYMDFLDVWSRSGLASPGQQPMLNGVRIEWPLPQFLKEKRA